jgi:RNA polymerase sigma-70 factor, ECF subfamily
MQVNDSASSIRQDEDDTLLVDRVLAGDRRAFEPLVRKHERRVYRVALSVLGNPEDAEEAMQDAFIRALRHLGQFRRESRFTTWLTRIAVNEAIRKRNSRKDVRPLSEGCVMQEPFAPKRCELWRSDPEQLFGKQEIQNLVENAIRALPEIYREAFVLRDVEHLTAEEAAEALGVTVAALKSRLLRARLLVRESLSEKLEQRPSLTTKVMHKAVDAGSMVAMRMMRAMSGQGRS